MDRSMPMKRSARRCESYKESFYLGDYVMSSMKFAKGPLYAALTIGVIGFLLLLLSRVGISLPFPGDLVGAGLGILTLVLLVVSVMMGSRIYDEDAITEDDFIPSVAFGPQGDSVFEEPTRLSWKEKMALKSQEKAARKAEAERRKFEEDAQRDASKAARRANRSGAGSDDAAEWLSEIRQDPTAVGDETSPFGTVSQPVFQAPPPAYPAYQQPAPPVRMTPIATAAAEMASNNYVTLGQNVDMTGASSATDAPMFEAEAHPEPDWAEAAYEDPAFHIPFTDEVNEDGVRTFYPETYNDVTEIASAYKSGDPVVVNLSRASEDDSRSIVNFGAGLVYGLDGAMERTEPKVFLLTPNHSAASPVDSGTSVVTDIQQDDVVVNEGTDVAVDIEELTHAEERLDRLAAELLIILEQTRSEIRAALGDGSSAEAHEEAVSRVAEAIHETRAAAASSLGFDLDETDSEDSERQYALARLQEIREAIARRDPDVEVRLDELTTEILTIIDRAKSEIARMRAENDEERARNEERIDALTAALTETRDEMTLLSQELVAASEQRKAALDTEGLLAQARIEAQKAGLERQQVAARLHQVRVALLQHEGNADLLAIVDRALEDIRDPAPEDSASALVVEDDVDEADASEDA